MITTESALAGVLQEGEIIQFVDIKDRRYSVTLESGKEFHSHAGLIKHDDVIGRAEGRYVKSTRGGSYLVIRPTLAELILKMPRGAQVIYPKDLGPLLMIADIFPGARVFESGVGSGALSMTMLRAGARITGYELREDFAQRAQKNVSEILGPEVLDRYDVQLRNAYDGIDETAFDRVVLDLPEPWQVIPHAAEAMRTGGVFVAYTPSVMQVSKVRETLKMNGFGMAETTEFLQRGWHVEGQAVRPDHRMVGHTGFLTSARLLEGTPPPSRSERVAKAIEDAAEEQ
jgi:tRNA (adenine57-N1/adenine58-N1)-methyltransferase